MLLFGAPSVPGMVITFPIMQRTTALLLVSRENTASSQAVVERGETIECAQLKRNRIKMFEKMLDLCPR